jgi:hypothetical protein
MYSIQIYAKITTLDLKDWKCAQYASGFYEARLGLLNLHTRCAGLVINHFELGFTTDLQISRLIFPCEVLVVVLSAGELLDSTLPLGFV